VFSVVYAMLVRPLPFPQPNQLYWITELLGRPKQETSVAGDYFTMRESMRGFSDMAAYDSFSVNWTGPRGPKQLTTGAVTSSFFSVLQTKPLLGRTFLPEEDLPGHNQAAILSYELWQREFGGDPALVGQTIRLNRNPVNVVGIMPRGFALPRGSDLWMPLDVDEAEQRQRKAMRIVQVIARSNLPLTQVNEELARLTGIVLNEYPSQGRGSGLVDGLRIYADSFQARLVKELRPGLLVFSGAVALMLMIVCFNVANLMLARATVRRREIAVRVALGAPRRRIVSQLFTESWLVSFLGGAVGLGLAALAIKLLSVSLAMLPSGLPEVSINPETAAFAVLLAILTGLVFGAVPAFGSHGFSVREALHRETRSSTGNLALRSMRQGLVVAQLALSLILLIGAGLLAKSFLQLRNTDPGFNPAKVFTARIALAETAYPTVQTQHDFVDRVLSSVQGVPGVESAAVMGGLNSGFFLIENRPDRRDEFSRTTTMGVTDEYFRSLGLRLLKGRLLSASDAPGRLSVVVVNDSFARNFFPGENPLGRRISIGIAAMPEWREIVGVVGDSRQFALDRDPGPTVYRSIRQDQNPFLLRMTLFVHSANPAPLGPTVERIVSAIDPDEPVYDVKTMEDRLSDSIGTPRFNASVVGSFALMAAFLASIGVYGVMSYLVTLRSQEMGIRLALGARPVQIERLILREGVVLGSIGAALGIAGALGLSRFLAALLRGVNTLDPTTFVAVTAVLFGIVLAACYFPGHRAAHADPLTVLRHE
jgi:putative ABC transport system permease protein